MNNFFDKPIFQSNWTPLIIAGALTAGMGIGGMALCNKFNIQIKSPFDLSSSSVSQTINFAEISKSNAPKIQIK